MEKNRNTHSFTFLLATGLVSSSILLPAAVQAQEKKYSIGVGLSTNGVDFSLSSTTNFKLLADDYIQWRVVAGGSGDTRVNNIKISDIEYDNVDTSIVGLRGGLDWYPFHSKWTDDIFFSSGLLYSNIEYEGKADMNKSFRVGSKTVNPGNISSFATKIDQGGVSPYVSVGWGNKINSGQQGRAFQWWVELGASMTYGTDVSITTVDPAGFLSVADVAAEKKEIENDIDGVSGFGTVTLSYLF